MTQIQASKEPTWFAIASKVWQRSHLVQGDTTLCGRVPPYYLPSWEREWKPDSELPHCKRCASLGERMTAAVNSAGKASLRVNVTPDPMLAQGVEQP